MIFSEILINICSITIESFCAAVLLVTILWLINKKKQNRTPIKRDDFLQFLAFIILVVIINKMMAKKRVEAGLETETKVPKNLPPKAKAKQKK